MYKNYSNRSRIPMPLKVLFFAGIAVLFIFIFGQVIMYLWNHVLVEVTGFKTITFWQAIGIFILSRILFGGFKSGHRQGSWKKRARKKFNAKMNERTDGKWMNMSEEERAAFRDNWKSWCDKKE